MFFEDFNDPAMKYEGLARAAFNNCDKFDDPWGYAAQERFGDFIEEPITVKGKRTLSTIIIKLIIDNQNTDKVIEFKKLEELVWTATTQEDIIEIVDRAIQIFKLT